MDGRLACQTDETTDAREGYSTGGVDCADCQVIASTRGVAASLIEDEPPGEITSLARSALGTGQRAAARASSPNEVGARLFARRQPRGKR